MPANKSNVANGSGAFTWRQFVRALCDTRARRNVRVANAPRHAATRARGFGNGKFFGARVAEAKTKPLPRLKRKSSGLADVLADERLEDGEDFFLLTARQLGRGFKNPPHFARRSRAAFFARGVAQEFIGADAENAGQRGQLVGAQRHGFPFPKGISPGRDVQLVGDLGLGQAGGFAQFMQALSESRARTFGWSAGLHGVSVTGVCRNQTKCLHRV